MEDIVQLIEKKIEDLEAQIAGYRRAKDALSNGNAPTVAATIKYASASKPIHRHTGSRAKIMHAMNSGKPLKVLELRNRTGLGQKQLANALQGMKRQGLAKRYTAGWKLLEK